MKYPELLDIYSDYLIASFSLVTATGLAHLLDNGYSHDKISRFLNQRRFDQKDFWKIVKKIIRKIENDNALLVVDDTIEEKPHSTENEIICYHWDHSKNRNIKGINLLNFLYYTDLSPIEFMNIPIAYEMIEKTEQYLDTKTGKIKRRSKVSKNELLRCRLRIICQINKVRFKYVLWDSWFSSKENFQFVHLELKRKFIGALKSNRTLALSYEDKLQGKFQNVSKLDLQSNRTYTVWLKGMDFPLLLVRQFFTNKDGSTGELYLVTNDLELSYDSLTTTYQKRWKVEELHKSLKNNASLEKSPTKNETSQSNHIFAAMIAYCKLEFFKIKEHTNHFALKSRLYIKAIQAAFRELQQWKQYDRRLYPYSKDLPPSFSSKTAEILFA